MTTLTGMDGDDLEVVRRLSARLAVLRAFHGPGSGDAFVARLQDQAESLTATTFTERYAAAALALLAAQEDRPAQEVRRLAHLAVGDADRHAEDAGAGRPLHIALLALASAGETALALRRSTAGLDASRMRGSLMGQARGLASRSLINVGAGCVTDAENDGRGACAVVADTGLDSLALGAPAAVAWALIERGRPREALALLAGTAPAGGVLGLTVSCLRGRALLTLHQPRDALDALETAARRAQQDGRRSDGVTPWRSLLAMAAFALGAVTRARRLATDELAAAERFGAAHEVGRSLRVVALVEDDSRARERAIALLRDGGNSLELAYALVDEGASRRRAGRRTQAREPLQEGMELAHAAGATALAERARVELRAAGARPRSVWRSGRAALTPSELRVAELAAQGLANREIAQALFVTVRTVEMHLTAAYRKLGVGARAELPAALRTSGPA